MNQDQGLGLTISSVLCTLLVLTAGTDEDYSFPNGVMRDGVEMSGLLVSIPTVLEELCG